MRKLTFCLYKCENEVADQMRGTCYCAADQRLCLRYRENTSVSGPEDSFFFGTRLIFNNNDKQTRQEGLSASSSVWGWESWVGLRQFID